MFEFMDPLLQRWRFNAATIAAIISLLLVCILAPVAEPRGVSAISNLQSSDTDRGVSSADSSPNAVTDGMALMAQDTGRAANATGLGFLKAGVSLTKGITYFDRGVEHGGRATAGLMVNGAARSLAFAGRTAGSALVFSGKAAGSAIDLVKYPFGHFHKLTALSSVIQPPDNAPVPTITQLRAQQATIIQEGTKDLSVLPADIGSGGACDAGMGNGGYPMSWCNAPMDTIQTVSYSSDAINRECTSYAYWYFTSIEGHTDFHVTGNARYWLGTSNYPTHATPIVGAIAVETAGAYGHVAIVQALPGQEYAGQPVPAGYALVSEMNYDWNGHFRYSYSPLSKFSAYIY